MTLYSFYRIVGSGVEDSEEYIGSTKQPLHKRLYEHKKNHKRDGKCSSKLIFQKYGIDNCSIILISQMECATYEEARREERKIYEERKKNAVNKVRPHATEEEEKKDRKELYEKNKDKIREQVKKWEENNVERRKEARKKYLEENKDKTNATQREYRLKRREKKLRLDSKSPHSSD